MQYSLGKQWVQILCEVNDVKDAAGIGIKAFVYSPFQKITEFNKDSASVKSDVFVVVAKHVSKLFNSLIDLCRDE